MFTVTRYRATVDPDTGELDWSAPDALDSDGWLYAPASSSAVSASSAPDRVQLVSRPTLYRFGLDFPDITARDRLALRDHPAGVPSSWTYSQYDTARLFDIDGEPGPWSNGVAGGWEIPLKRVTG